jgi:hypothetical protein
MPAMSVKRKPKDAAPPIGERLLTMPEATDTFEHAHTDLMKGRKHEAADAEPRGL